MSKKLIHEYLEVDWIGALEGKSAEDVVKWLGTCVPEGYNLCIDYSRYDGDYAVLETHREETDEEYSTRIYEEQEATRKHELREVQAALSLQNKIAILRGQDLSLANYLEKHKDNPRIGDLENLYITLHQALTHGSNNQVINSLKECMEMLEGGK